MSSFHARSRAPMAVALLYVTLLGCAAGDPAGPARDPLTGLVDLTRADSTPVPPNTPTEPGSFRGSVLGYSEGPDTLATGAGLAGVRVTAYDRAESGGRTAAGQQVASVITNASGAFQLPTLPGGEYVITFVPPAGSSYEGGWTTARAWSGSGATPWAIWLRRKD